MFSRKKKPPVKKPRGKGSAAMDFGIGIPGFGPQPSEDDAELEAELYALTGNKSEPANVSFDGGDEDDDLEAELAKILGKKSHAPSSSNSRTNVLPAVNPRGQFQPTASIDVGSDVDDEDVDENDPELLRELHDLTIGDTENAAEVESEEEVAEAKEVTQLELVRSRLEMYRTAESKAKAEKETARARRFNRGVKTLERLLKRCEAGEIVPYTEIPPEVAANLKPAAAAPPELERVEDPKLDDFDVPASNPDLNENTNDSSDPLLDIFEDQNVTPTPSEIVADSEPKQLTQTNDLEPQTPVTQPTPEIKFEPKPVAVTPSEEKVKEQPIVILLRARKDELKKHALAAKKSGDMPAALESMRMIKVCDKLIESSLAGNVVNKSEIPIMLSNSKVPLEKVDIQKSVPFVSGEIFAIPKTVQEALDQRLKYFEQALLKAEVTGDRSSLKKCGDIVKIYKNAIRLHQRGSQIPYERLPSPPGCPPIPIAFRI